MENCMTKKVIKNSKKKIAHKIALYIRVSTEEQASNPEGSIKSQEQRLRHHVQFRNYEEHWGEVADVFIDRAKSGKDTNRPQLQRLLKSIERGEISLVMVTELSRLSRNIKDFCEIWDLMREHNCEFQSLREQFDTTSAAGEMVLMTLANIAQFERKQVSERVKYNFQARAERGLFNGGSVPMGYRSHSEKKGYLEIHEDEAKIVREIFKTFLKEGTLAKTGKSLHENGFSPPKKKYGGVDRVGSFTVDNLHDTIRNRSYLGERPIKTSDGVEYIKACWPPIIEKEDFDKCQELLASNRYRPKSYLNKRYPFELSGFLYCDICKSPLCGKSAHGTHAKIPYYEHSWFLKKQAYLSEKINCSSHKRIQAKILEEEVWQKVKILLANPKMAERLLEKAQKIHDGYDKQKNESEIKSRINEVKAKLETIAEHLTQIPKGVSPEPIFKQMQKLEEQKQLLEEKLTEMRSSEGVNELPSTLRSYKGFLELLRGEFSNGSAGLTKNEIMRRLIQKIEVTRTSFKVHYYVGQDTIQKSSRELKNLYSEDKMHENTSGEANLASSDFYMVGRSKRLTNGDLTPT